MAKAKTCIEELVAEQPSIFSRRYEEPKASDKPAYDDFVPIDWAGAAKASVCIKFGIS